MPSSRRALGALSGGVDSAVAAWLLVRAGYAVECLHMTNWDDDDGYCNAAADLADARGICDRLGVPLHRVNFAREYQDHVFADFLSEIRAGRTPNPDVLCNREIKFGVLMRYALRLGADCLATGHYARIGRVGGGPSLLKGTDPEKDQSYFLHAVDAGALTKTLFPLGGMTKTEVRALAREAGFEVAAKRDSTGICFIGERPFGAFLGRFIAPRPGPIVTDTGRTVGEHRGLHLYTLGQRKGLGIGGTSADGGAPWYVAAKRTASNELVVVQGHDHPALFSDWLETAPLHFVGAVPAAWAQRGSLDCHVRTRYRQADQACTISVLSGGGSRVSFARPQRALTPGQYAVFYFGERCLGGARIEGRGTGAIPALAAGETG